MLVRARALADLHHATGMDRDVGRAPRRAGPVDHDTVLDAQVHARHASFASASRSKS